MFSRYFNLIENPFGETSSERCFFSSPTHLYAIQTAASAIENKKGLVLITGEVGSGKTLLSKITNSILERAGAQTAYIQQPILGGVKILTQIADEFGIERKAEARTQSDLELICLNEHLIKNVAEGKTNVLLIDEAHKLSFDSLEIIRLLANIETHGRKILQTILFAQPELQIKLATNQMRQIQQRITSMAEVQPLSLAETQSYIRFRIDLAGGSNFVWFERCAVKTIFKHSRGIPRLINFYCEIALLAADAQLIRYIKAPLVRENLKSQFNTAHGFNRFIKWFEL